MDIIKKFQISATCAIVIGFGVFIYYDHSVNEPKAAIAQHELEKEFAAIRPFDKATASGFHSNLKSSHALVGSSYSTPASFGEIRLYYVQELARLGWRLQDEKAAKDWGRDLGGKVSTFCKGQYKADLQYAGATSKYGWVYGLDLSWGLGPQCSTNSYTEFN